MTRQGEGLAPLSGKSILAQHERYACFGLSRGAGAALHALHRRLWTAAQPELGPADARGRAEKALREFCCSRIDHSAVRSRCESDAEAQCGFAASGTARVTNFSNMGHGDVAFGTFSVEGPRGKGSCEAQFLRTDGSWFISTLSCRPAEPRAPA